MKDRNELLEEMAHPKSERVLRIQLGLKTAGCPAEYLEESTLELLEEEEMEERYEV